MLLGRILEEVLYFGRVEVDAQENRFGPVKIFRDIPAESYKVSVYKSSLFLVWNGVRELTRV
jgi:hypothetical protein